MQGLKSSLLLVAALAPAALSGAQDSVVAGRIFFSKSFPGSSPAYSEIELDHSGKAVYRESPDDNQPIRFEIPPPDTRAIFALAEQLQFFRLPLESKLKVANMGMKTLRYEIGGVVGECKFNYSENLNARSLVDWFEKISETEQHLIALERTARFDRLGVNKALLLLENSWEKNRIVAPEQLLPILDKIARQRSYMHIAQARAASLAERIRAGKSPP